MHTQRCRRISGIGLCLLLSVLFILSACSSNSGNSNTNKASGNSSGTPAGTKAAGTTTVTNALQPTTTTTPTIGMGTQACPAAIQDPAHWDAIIPTQAGTSKVESVICANLMGNTSLQAMVTVRSNGSGAFLDVYVFNKITDPNPQLLFKLLHLDRGDAKISGYNTVVTSEVDTASSVNVNAQGNAALVPDLCREFKWSDGAGTLVPVTFPGIFPDISRYQAEADQHKLNQGQGQGWQLSATQMATMLATQLLKWPSTATATVVSGGGKNDASAVVNVKSPAPGNGGIKVTLSRLEGNTNGGIWIATQVASSGNLTITTPQPQSLLTSPVTVTGTGDAFEGVIGPVTILDHTYTDIGHAQAKGATGMGKTTFSTNVSYTSTFKGGTEEGIVAVYELSNADGSIATATMIKVLLS